jgi:hypothetical protein
MYSYEKELISNKWIKNRPLLNYLCDKIRNQQLIGKIILADQLDLCNVFQMQSTILDNKKRLDNLSIFIAQCSCPTSHILNKIFPNLRTGQQVELISSQYYEVLILYNIINSPSDQDLAIHSNFLDSFNERDLFFLLYFSLYLPKSSSLLIKNEIEKLEYLFQRWHYSNNIPYFDFKLKTQSINEFFFTLHNLVEFYVNIEIKGLRLIAWPLHNDEIRKYDRIGDEIVINSKERKKMYLFKDAVKYKDQYFIYFSVNTICKIRVVFSDKTFKDTIIYPYMNKIECSKKPEKLLIQGPDTLIYNSNTINSSDGFMQAISTIEFGITGISRLFYLLSTKANRQTMFKFVKQSSYFLIKKYNITCMIKPIFWCSSGKFGEYLASTPNSYPFRKSIDTNESTNLDYVKELTETIVFNSFVIPFSNKHKVNETNMIQFFENNLRALNTASLEFNKPFNFEYMYLTRYANKLKLAIDKFNFEYANENIDMNIYFSISTANFLCSYINIHFKFDFTKPDTEPFSLQFKKEVMPSKSYIVELNEKHNISSELSSLTTANESLELSESFIALVFYDDSTNVQFYIKTSI